jgi:hypothetical protein
MQIEKKQLREWKLLKEQGDVTEIMRRAGNVSRVTISNALNKGTASVRVYEAILTFYNERKEQIKAIA